MSVRIAEDEAARAALAYRAAKDARRQHDDKRTRAAVAAAMTRMHSSHTALARAIRKERSVEDARRSLMTGAAG